MSLYSVEITGYFERSIKQELETCKQLLDERKRQKTEYEELSKELEDFPKKLTQEMLVPRGSVAFIPGHFQPASEVVIRLGDDYFAALPANQATEVIKRRLNLIDSSINGIYLKSKLLEERLKVIESHAEIIEKLQEVEIHAGDLSRDEVEIREEYNEEKERIFWQNRLARKGKQSEAIPKPETSAQEKNAQEYLSRLDALEAEERTNQLSSDEEEDEVIVPKPPPGVDPKVYAELLARVDALMESSDDEYDEDENETEDEEDDMNGTFIETESVDMTQQCEQTKDNVVQNTRNRQGKKLGVRFSADLEAGPSGDGSEAISNSRVKPILKNKNPSPVDRSKVGELEREVSKSTTILPSSALAFPGEIVEHLAGLGTSAASLQSAQSNEPPKRASKFKQMRSH